MKKRGIGYGSMFYGLGYGFSRTDIASATLEISQDGSIIARSGEVDYGQGSDTVFCQIIAEELGVDYSAIKLITADTDVTPDSGPTSASRLTFVGGNAFIKTSRSLKKILNGVAEDILGASDLVFREGMVFSRSAPEKSISFKYTPEEEGIYFFQVDGPKGLTGKSNVLLCRKGQASLNLYFGDIHGHSRQSDGTGTPEDYYRYAREVSGLDISSLTDHADFGTIPIRGDVWERIKEAANQAYQPGRFVTFVAFEWTNWIYGHRNVYYRDGDGPIFRSIDPESNTPEKLWKVIEPYQAMTIAHHVGGGPIATDWSIPPGPKEWLVEISSIHGSSEYYGCESCIYRPVRGAFVRDALARGYKLGIFGSGDNHDGHPGNGSVGAPVTGLLGVYSTGLTREEVWEAFQRRQVYGTSGPKIILNFRVADAPMGSEVTWERSRGAIPIAIRAVACDKIDRVEIIRNGKIVFSVKGDGVFAQHLLEDDAPPGGESWYYAKIIQQDGQMAWSSPVWVEVESGE